MGGYGFNVITGGQADALDAIIGYQNGDVAYGAVNGVHLVYQMNLTSGAVHDGDVYVAPSDTTGDARWVKMVPGGAMSRVEATMVNTPSIPDDTTTNLIYTTENKDTLDEYSPVTGEFIAKNDGVYIFSLSVQTSVVSWAINNVMRFTALVNATDIKRKQLRTYSSTTNWHLSWSDTITLLKDDVLVFGLYQNSGSSVTLGTNTSLANYLTINRLV